MAHKICAAIHIFLALGLFGLFDVVKSPTDVYSVDFLILASLTSAVGCWKRWRWLVALAGVPIVMGAVVIFGVAMVFKQVLGSKGMLFLVPIAVLVCILEISSFVYAKKVPEDSAKPLSVR